MGHMTLTQLFSVRMLLAQVRYLLVAQPMLKRHSKWYQELSVKIGTEVQEHMLICPGCEKE